MVGEKVAVEIKDFMNAAFKCPTCRMSCDATVVNRHGQKVTKCWQCGQKLIKESGEWKTLNHVIQDRGRYKEAAAGPVQNPQPVAVTEGYHIEGRKWQCLNCMSQNETKLPEFPLSRLIDEHGERREGLFMRCWACSLIIQNTGNEGKEETWEVLRNGNLKKGKEVIKQ